MIQTGKGYASAGIIFATYLLKRHDQETKIRGIPALLP
jgi:hypothetical protein